MSDETAKMARLMRVTDAVVAELDRQGVTEAVANLGFDPVQMAQAVLRAADGDVIPFPRQTPWPMNISAKRSPAMPIGCRATRSCTSETFALL
jgi:hypothetical protein